MSKLPEANFIERMCPIPEGVEVRISAELIKPLVINKIVDKIYVGNNSRYVNNPPEGYNEFNKCIKKIEDIGSTKSHVKISDIKTKGKFTYWTFNNNWYMFSTFGMTGQWSPNEGKHVCFCFRLYDEKNDIFNYIYFNDPRHFGTIRFVYSDKELKNKLNELGWDPLSSSGLNDAWLNWIHSELMKLNKPIGQALLDQTIFAGVGNYIRAEALYLAKLSPWRISNTLSKNEIKHLSQAIIDVMQESYKHQGATLLTYKDSYGNEGKYSSCFKVYGRHTDTLGNTIKTELTPEGRTIHWCPNIQK